MKIKKYKLPQKQYLCFTFKSKGARVSKVPLVNYQSVSSVNSSATSPLDKTGGWSVNTAPIQCSRRSLNMVIYHLTNIVISLLGVLRFTTVWRSLESSVTHVSCYDFNLEIWFQKKQWVCNFTYYYWIWKYQCSEK